MQLRQSDFRLGSQNNKDTLRALALILKQIYEKFRAKAPMIFLFFSPSLKAWG